MIGFHVTFFPGVSGWCSTPNQLLICSSFSTKNGHPLLTCSSLSTSQVCISKNVPHFFLAGFFIFNPMALLMIYGIFKNHFQPLLRVVQSWKLTYPLPRHFWLFFFSFSQGTICFRSLDIIFQQLDLPLPSYSKKLLPSSPCSITVEGYRSLLWKDMAKGHGDLFNHQIQWIGSGGRKGSPAWTHQWGDL